MVKVLVLGATGFIGGHIAKKALDEGWDVCGFRRDPQASGQLNGLRISWREGTLEDYPTLVSAMQDMDYVFHAAACAASDGNPAGVKDHVQKGIDQMKNIIRAVRESRVRRLIYTSSLTTIGLPPVGEDRLADERDFYQPGSLPDNGYYEVKAAMERLALEASEVGYNIVILNPTLVLGPGDVHLSTGEIVLTIARGKAPFLPPGEVNIIDVRDAAAAHINAARIGRSGERYILGGDNYSIKEAATTIADIAAVKPPSLTFPTAVLDLYIKTADLLPFVPRAHDQVRAYKNWQGYNTDKARQELKLGSRFLEETARDSVKWFADRGYL